MAAALFLLQPPANAHGQVVERIRLQLDNDAFNFWVPRRIRPDYEYTSGARLLIQARTASWWGGLVPGYAACAEPPESERRCLSTTWELGQRIYTPRHNTPLEMPGERPHAGWLYGAVTAQAADAGQRHALRLELGVTGRPSLAETLQTVVHRIGGFREPLGWERQLAFEPGVLARYEYARLVAEPELGGIRVGDLAQEVGFTVGNVRTGAHAGSTLRFGYDVPRPWTSAARTGRGTSIFLNLGARGDWVLHDLTLDGNTFRQSPRVERIPLVGRYHLGVSLRVGEAELEYRVVSRSREYRTEPTGHRYSTISLDVRP